MAATKQATEQEIIRILKALKSLSTGDKTRRPSLERDLAEATLSYREHFLTDDGKPDMTGRTGAYRWAVRDLYSEAGYQPEDAVALQKRVRYHTGNRVRELLSEEELEDHGLSTASPRARQNVRQQSKLALLSAIGATGDADTMSTEQEKVAALRDVLATLSKVRPNKRSLRTVDNLDLADAGHKVLRAIIAQAETLLDAYPAKET